MTSWRSHKIKPSGAIASPARTPTGSRPCVRSFRSTIASCYDVPRGSAVHRARSGRVARAIDALDDERDHDAHRKTRSRLDTVSDRGRTRARVRCHGHGDQDVDRMAPARTREALMMRDTNGSRPGLRARAP